jgi:hypothetical protein
MVLGAGAAYAFWNSQGSGTSTQQNAQGGAEMVVTSPAISGLTPGGSLALAGVITNSGPDAMAGEVKVTSITVNGGLASDYAVTGIALVNANVPTGAQGVAWSGLSLNYLNTAVDQEAGKGATVTLHYTVTPFVQAVSATVPISGQRDIGTCGNGNAGTNGYWADDAFNKFYQLKAINGGYNLQIDYLNGTFVTVGGTSPGACESSAIYKHSETGNGSTVVRGVTGNQFQTMSANIVTTAPVVNVHPSCGGTACNSAQGFLDAVFGSGIVTVPSGGFPNQIGVYTNTNNAWLDYQNGWPLNDTGDILK